MGIKIYKTKVNLEEVKTIAQSVFGDMAKGVIDVRRKVLALGGELHADAEAVLLKDGSVQEDLWGFNIYPGRSKDDRIEYTSLINIRPKQGNLQTEVKDEGIRRQIKSVVDNLVD